MNTEIIDYIRALAKKDNFVVNMLNCVFSGTIIVCGLFSIRNGATMLLYTIMFFCTTFLLGLNSYKCFKRGSKNGWVFAILCLLFMGATAISIYALMQAGV